LDSQVWQGRQLAKQTEIQLAESAFRKPFRAFLSFLDIPDSLLAVAQAEESGCADYFGFIMQARTSDKGSNSAFRAR
jgi:hypothetical protein